MLGVDEMRKQTAAEEKDDRDERLSAVESKVMGLTRRVGFLAKKLEHQLRGWREVETRHSDLIEKLLKKLEQFETENTNRRTMLDAALSTIEQMKSDAEAFQQRMEYKMRRFEKRIAWSKTLSVTAIAIATVFANLLQPYLHSVLPPPVVAPRAAVEPQAPTMTFAPLPDHGGPDR